MLTAYTTRMAQLLDAHTDVLLVGDSLGQAIYGLALHAAGQPGDDDRARGGRGARIVA